MITPGPPHPERMLTPICLIALSLLSPSSRQGPSSQYSPHVEPASEEGRQVMSRFELLDGFELALFAAEPLLANPVCLYVDHRGDCYVAETFRHHAGVTDIRNHMDWLEDDLSNQSVGERVGMLERRLGQEFDSFATEHERIRLIRDTDGDLVADDARVFADGFSTHAAGIGAGLLAHEGQLYYTCIPDLWSLRDEDGDGRADTRRALSTGYGVNIALLGHDLHGLRIGPDGKLYFSCGDRGFRVETERGVIDHAHTGAVLRCDLDGQNLEVFATGLRNPQELVFDEFGNLFTGDNNSDGGDKARWVHVIEGSDSGWRYSYQWLTKPIVRGAWNDEKLWYPHFPGQAAYILPPIANLVNGPSGLTYHPGTGLAPEYRRHFFLCDFRGDPKHSGIYVFDLQAKGASFELGTVERLVFGTLVTDADFGPDGALYFTDWVQGWNKTGKGRVYRLTHPAMAADEERLETKQLLKEGMREREIEALEGLLAHADQRVRQEAQFELVRRSESGMPALLRAAESSDSLLARLHGIWGLGMLHERGHGSLGPLPEMLTDPEIEVRAQAARVLGDARLDAREAETELESKLIEALADESARVRLRAAIALGKHGVGRALEPLINLLDETGERDPALRHAAIMGLVGCAGPQELLSLAEHPSASVRIGAVVALRRMREPGLARFLADSEPLVVVEAARAICDLPLPGALPDLARLIEHPLLESETLDDNALVRRVLNANFRLGGLEQARALANFAMRDDQQSGRRREALDLLSMWAQPPGRDPLQGDWRPLVKEGEQRDASFMPGVVRELLEGGIGEAPTPIVKAWIRLAAELARDSQAPTLLQWGLDPERTASIRSSALRALRAEPTPELESRLRAALFDREEEVRAAALFAFQRIAPDKVLPLIATSLEGEGVEERRVAYQTLGRFEGEAADRLLLGELTKLADGSLPDELALDLVLAAEKRGAGAVKAELERRQSASEADQLMAPFLDSLTGGSAERGRAVFLEKIELSCLRCHAVEGAQAGHGVGPALAGVGERLTRLELLESIANPNRTIAEGYQATLFVLANETATEGRLLDERDGLVRIQTSDGGVSELEAEEILSRRPGLSAMPEGLTQFLTRSEMRDLLEYLARL